MRDRDAMQKLIVHLSVAGRRTALIRFTKLCRYRVLRAASLLVRFPSTKRGRRARYQAVCVAGGEAIFSTNLP